MNKFLIQDVIIRLRGIARGLRKIKLEVTADSLEGLADQLEEAIK